MCRDFIYWYRVANPNSPEVIMSKTPVQSRRRQFRAAFINTNDIIRHQFVEYDPDFSEQKEKRDPLLVHMEEQLNDFEKQGHEMVVSRQYYLEAKWFEEYTAHFTEFDRLRSVFEDSLKDTAQPEQMKQAEDGSWGKVLTMFFQKFDQTVDAINDLSDEDPLTSPEYPLTFMQQVGTPETRDQYLKGILVSDISHTGVNNRDALNAVASGLAQFCFKNGLKKYIRNYTTGFDLTDEYIETYKNFIQWWQDDTTGYWGAWYKTDFGIVHTSDLSVTFHLISYLKKGDIEIRNWPAIIETTFEIKNRPYPYGWMHEGHMNDHNNYDVAKIFKYGWKHMTDSEQKRAQADISEMLEYCLNVSWSDEQGFVGDPSFYNSLSSAYYFGVSFLCTIGYFSKDSRFWTDRDFPESEEFRQKILAKMDELGLDDRIAESARERLASC